MRNKYAGMCGCGRRVAAGKGTLDLSNDRWTVRCGRCDGMPAAEHPAADATGRKRPGKSWRRRGTGARPRTAKTAVAPRRKAGAAKRAAGQRGKAPGRKAVRPGMAPSPTLETVKIADGGGRHVASAAWAGATVCCSLDFAELDAELTAAETAGERDRAFDLAVALAEMAFLGHVADVPAAATAA